MGLDLATFTAIHTVLSLVAIVAGVPVCAALLRGAGPPESWAWLFLVTAIATSVTGFGFPFTGLLPSHIVGIIALVVLAAALVARFVFAQSGWWGTVYAASLVASLYFLVFVAVAQAFAKFGPLRALAPTQSEPPFAVAQLVVLGVFLWLGYAAGRRAGRLPA